MTPEDRMRKLGSTREGTPSEAEWTAFAAKAHLSVTRRRMAAAIGGLVTCLVVVAGAYAVTGNPVGDQQSPGPAGSPTQTASPSPDAPSTEAEPSPESDPTVAVQQWFFQGEQMTVFYEEVPQTETPATMAMRYLLAGQPQSAGAQTYIPNGVDLLDLSIKDGIATVDLSSEFEEANLGSSFAGAHIAQVTYTLTQYPTVDGVIFEIEGERVGTKDRPFGSHGLVMEKPQTRAEWDSLLAPIVVESPYPGQTVDWTFDLFGIANVYEATVSWTISDAEGNIVKEGFSTATCGSGCWGTFEDRISIERQVDTELVLEVFQASAEDGSPMSVVQIPLNFVE